MATSFKIKLSKSANQQTITIDRDDNVNLSAVTSITASVYTDDLGTADNTYAFTGGNVTSFLAGSVDISVEDLLGSATPDDEFYSVILSGNSGDYLSDIAGVAITLEALYQVFNNQGEIDVYSPDFSVDRALVTSFMLVYEMDNIEKQDSSKQKRADFTTRWDTLKQILNYE